MKLILHYLLLFIFLAGGNVIAQGELSTGIKIEPLFSFTGLTPSLEGAERTYPNQEETFNYRIGLHGNFKFDFGLGIATGVDFTRSRFGFIHEQEIANEAVKLWGHGENYSYGFPLDLSYSVYENTEPSLSIIPYAGISIRQNFSAYRNMTRLDKNRNYTYSVVGSDQLNSPFITTVRAGVKLRKILERMGLIDFYLMFSTDLNQLPSFTYEITSGDDTFQFDQHQRLSYFSLGISLHLINWEMSDGKLIRMRY